MKKRIISMLLAVCMVVACTLAITPAVSAEVETIITVEDITGDVGDTITVPFVVTTPDGEDFGFSAIGLTINKIPGLELVSGVDAEGGELGVYPKTSSESKGIFDWGDSYQLNLLTIEGDWIIPDGEAVISLCYTITGFVNAQIDVSIDSLGSMTDAGAVAIPFTFVPGTISVDGGFERIALTASDLFVTDEIDANEDGSPRTMTASEKTKYNPNAKGVGQNGTIKIVTKTLNYTFEGDVAYIDSENWAAINDTMAEFMPEYNSFVADGETVTKVGTKAKGTAGYSCEVSRADNKFTGLVDLYIASDVDFTLTDILWYFVPQVENIYFLGGDAFEYDTKWDDEAEWYVNVDAIDAFARFDASAEDYGAPVGKIYAWSGSPMWCVFKNQDVLDYLAEYWCFEDDAPSIDIQPLDSFVPVGYQGPAEATGKKFRVDSALKFADTALNGNEHAYTKAVCYIKAETSGGETKYFTQTIDTVYKSLSSANGVAIPACDGYYFSALAITDLPDLPEGDFITFTFINEVTNAFEETNAFEATTKSAPVSLVYHADGRIEKV